MMWRVKKFWKDLQRDFIPAQRACWLKETRGKKSPLKRGLLPGAGRYSRVKLHDISMLVSGLLGMLLGMLGIVVLGLIFSFAGVLQLVAVILTIIFIVCAVPVWVYWLDDYELGALGEAAVAEELDKLGRPQWRVFHSFEGKYGDIDHIIVCPKGVFCVETKTPRKHPEKTEKLYFRDGAIWKGANKDSAIKLNAPDPVCQTRRNARWLHGFLTGKCFDSGGGKKLPFIASIVAFPGWDVERLHGNYDHRDLIPCNPEQIGGIFANRKDILSDAQIATIVAALEKETRVS